MKQDNFNEFMAVMGVLTEMFGTTRSAGVLRMYWDSLQQFDLEDIKRAAQQIVETKKVKTFPLIAEFLDILDNRDGRSLVAWQAVMQAIERAGIYESPKFTDPVVSHVLQHFGGWVRFCMLSRDQSESEWDWTRKEFVKTYQTLARYSREIDPVPMIGLHDQHNETFHPIRLPAPQQVKQIEAIPEGTGGKEIGGGV